MKKFSLIILLSLLSVVTMLGQGMSDTQVLQFIAAETKAGTSQGQIVTKLIQKGVKIDQIRRLRSQYDKQLRERGASGAADAAVGETISRLRHNNGEQPARLTDAKQRIADEVYQESDVNYDAAIQQDIDAREMNVFGQFDGKKVFGRDIFNNKALSFEPNMNLATPQDYVLGPGDQVIIDIYGASQKTEQLTVSPDGTVTIPGYGPVHVSGLTVAAAQSKLRGSLGTRYASSDLRLTVGQTRTLTVQVMGEVKVPGTYTLSAFATVFHALYMAGGINDLGTLRNIKVYRAGRQVTVVDIYEYILHGRLAGNVRLRDGDVIQVGPYDCLVGMAGNVKRPMFYEMRPTESLSTLLEYAGGFTGDAYRKQLRVFRKTGERYGVYNVGEFELGTFKVADGDSVEVDGILNRYENTVELKGAVFRPGKYQLGKAISTVKSLIEQAEGVTEDAFTGHAILHRLKADRTLETIPVDLQGILDGTVADIALNNEDVLFVLSQEDHLSERILTITGEVFSPGVYEYADNTTIEDLIIQAGGLTDQASTARVDVSRRIRDPKSTTKSKEISRSFTLSLRDGLLVGSERGFTLEPYDVVHVRRSPGYHEPRMMTVEGEVMFEGTYTLQDKNQRLSDVVRMAGGLSEDAYVKGARLERRMNDTERARMQATLKLARQQAVESDTIDLSMLETADSYSVGIYLDKALQSPGSDYDVVLREGDRLIIPEYNGTVKVSGNVMYANTVAFEKGKNYKYYVNQAGGFGNRAKKSHTYIVYQNGTVSKVGKGKVEPGCELIVPTKPKKDGNSLTQWLTVGTSLASLATMFATIANLIK